MLRICAGNSQSNRWRARFICALLAALILTLVVSAMLLGLGHWVAFGTDASQPSELIVALGGDDGHRVRKVANLFREGFAPRVLVTGLEGAPETEREHYLNWRSRVLAEAGIPRDAVLFDLKASNSREEAMDTLDLMRERGWQRAIVVSDPPHMRRLHWVWGRVFSGSGKSFVLVSSEPAWWQPDRWWANERSGQFVLTEVIKLGYYFAKY